MTRTQGAEIEPGSPWRSGRYGVLEDGDCVVVTAHEDDRLAAVLQFVRRGSDGLSLELMRRDRSADPGVDEFMIVRTPPSGRRTPGEVRPRASSASTSAAAPPGGESSR